MAKVFISYSRKDIEFARKLTDELKKSELDFWVDWEGIPPTVDWWKEIEKGIEEADAFLFLISPDSAKSKVCGQEIDTAVKNGKRIIPIVVREIEWQDTPPQLGHLNYIFYSRADVFDTATKKLLNALHTDFEWIQAHRRLQVKALEWERHNKNDGFLLRGMDLQNAERDLATNTSKDPHPTDLQREYVFASRKATDRQRRILTGVTLAGVIVMAALAVFGLFQANQASNSAATAQANLVVAQTAQADAQNKAVLASSIKLAAQSELASTRDFHSSLLLAVEAFRTLDRPQTRGALINAANANPQMIQYFPSQSQNVTDVKFSPNGELVASIGNEKIQLWNKSSLTPVSQIPNEAGYSIAFSPNGKILAASRGADIILWNLDNPDQPKQIGQPLTGHTGIIFSLMFSPDGQKLASGSFDQTTILWNVSDPTKPSRLNTFKGHENIVRSVAFSPDGKYLASGALDFKINIWDVSTGELYKTLTGSHPDSLAFSPNGKILAAGQEDYTITLWNMETGQPIGQPLAGHTDIVSSVAFNFDGTLLASGSRDTSIILWDPTTGRRIGQSLTGHAGAIWGIAFNPINNSLVSGGADGMILWDAGIQDTPRMITNDYYHCGRATSCPNNIAISADGKILAAGALDNSIVLWNLETLQPIGSPLTGLKSEVFSLAFSPDGKTLASSSIDSSDIVLWDTATGQQLGEPLKGYTGIVYGLAFAPTTGILVSSSFQDQAIILWDAQTQKPIGQPIPEAAWDIAISPNGKLLATSNLSLWNLDDPAHPQQIQGPTPPGGYTIAFSPNGKILALGGDNGSITLWDVEKRQSIGLPIMGHAGPVLDVAFSPDGKTLASGSWDLTMALWDVSNPEQPIAISKPYRLGSKVTSLAFSTLEGGNLLVSGSWGKLLLWNLDPQFLSKTACARAGRNFTRLEWAQYFPGEEYRKTCEQWPLEP